MPTTTRSLEMATVKRPQRVAEQMRAELSVLFAQLRDPRVQGVSVTEIVCSPDLQVARVYVRRTLATAEATVKEQKTILAGLESASGGMRGEICRRLSLRHAPRFSFFYDESPEAKHRIDTVLEEIARAPKGKSDE
jgi:ribosome-binding factor A